MGKHLSRAIRLVPFVLIATVLLALVFFPHAEKKAEAQRIVTIWNVDTFEGGKGSRTAFLGRVARLAEKGMNITNTYYYVTAMSAEGAIAELKRGKRPDLLSFGIGLGCEAACGIPLGREFAGGDTSAGCLAVPWCGGGYYLFSLDEKFEEEGEIAISCGGSNLPAVIAALEGIHGLELPSEAAYTGFLGGKYRYLLGTQRDLCRAAARGVTVYSRPLGAYNDLFQYISLLSSDKERECKIFLDVLFSDEIQGSLGDIGMSPAASYAGQTVSVFLSDEARGELAEAARAGAQKIPWKFLKKV